MQYGLLAGDHQRVARVVTTLKTCNRGSFVRQQVDDFALTLIAPLRTNDYNVFSYPQFLDLRTY